MKKIFLVLGVIVVVLVVGVVIFIATFDADRYRPFVVQKLESAIGKPVKLGRISLGWKGGIALQLKDLVILEAKEGKPVLELQSANALLRFAPLLKKSVEIGSITLMEPRIRIVRHPDGTLNITAPAEPAKKEPVKKEGAALAFLIGEISVVNGSLSFRDEMQHPPRDLLMRDIDIAVKNISLTQPIELQNLSAWAFGGTIKINGTIRDVMSEPKVTATITLKDLSLKELFPPPPTPDVAQLQGRFSASFEGSMQGKAWPEISKTLAGQGRLTLTEGVIRNLNVVRDLFQRLSILPGLVEVLEVRLPESYRAKLASQDTKILEPIDLPVTVQNGAITLQHLVLITDTFELEGKGEARFDGEFSSEAKIRLEQSLSGAVVKSVSELNFLANDKGQIELPLKIEAHPPHVSILPDLSYVTSRLAGGKASELLSHALGKTLRKEEAPESQDVVGTLLQNILGQQK